MRRALLQLLPAVLLLVLVPVSSLDAQVTQSRAREFMQKAIGFTAADLAGLDRGDAVTTLLDTEEKGEVAAFGAVVVNAPSEIFFDQARDVMGFFGVPGIEQIGRFSDPPRAEDLAGLTFPEDDVDDMRRCQPGKCNVKLGAEFMDRLVKNVDWEASGAKARAVELVKQRIAEVLVRYQEQGTAALGSIVDKENPKVLTQEFATILANSPYFVEYIPEFFDYLRDYPKIQREDVRDAFYWAKDTFAPKPTISLYHMTSYREGGRAVIAQKLLWASHFFNAGLEFWAVAPHADGKSFDLLIVYRTRLDPPTGMLSGVLLGRVRKGIETGVRQSLENAKAKTEAAAR